MATDIKKKTLDEIKETFGRVPEWMGQVPDQALPGMWATMRDFHLAETEIPNKYKELIGLAVAGATRCRYCAMFHTETARLFGATDREIAEASLMAGISMQASTFVNAQQVDYERFAKETRDIVAHVKKQRKAGTGRARPSAQA